MVNRYHESGLLLKTDTLRGFRDMSHLTLKAFAGEMGMSPRSYQMLEDGKGKVKTYHLKAALNVVRIMHLKRML